MNVKLRDVFRGKVVNKAHTINTGVDEFPRYVREYLIDHYCSEESFEQDMERVVRRLKETFVYGAEAEKIRHYIREDRQHSVIANLDAPLVATEDKYWAAISAINESFVNIPESIVRQYPMLLSGGMWGTIDLTYDETELHRDDSNRVSYSDTFLVKYWEVKPVMELLSTSFSIEKELSNEFSGSGSRYFLMRRRANPVLLF